ncbi:2-nitropropane dioxygenase [Abortiporus biennis]|nr:2-nitropropane dioxygenase [Abortiporus biennis]
MSLIQTPITDLFHIKHPILLAGMDKASGPELAAAVTNAGGLGVIGGFGYTPNALRILIKETKKNLHNKNAPFGVDLLLPQVGGNARKTNYDYTKGKLPELIDIVIEEKAALFVAAVGTPPKWVVDRLHQAGIPIMNMVGHPKHVTKAIAAGVDLVCAQAGEGGGHTGDIPASILIPACVDAAKGHISSFTGKPIYVIGAGAIFDGRGLAANLSWGAQGVWVGTRFLASTESGAPQRHKELVVSAGFEDTVKSLIYTGRPARLRMTPYISNWHNERKEELHKLLSEGKVPWNIELDAHPDKYMESFPYPMGQVCSMIHEILPAKTIVDTMAVEAAEILKNGGNLVKVEAKL